MNEKFNTPEEVNAFLNSSEFVEGLKKYLISLLEEHQTEISPVLNSIAAMLDSPVLKSIAATLDSMARAIPPDVSESMLRVLTDPPEDLKAIWKTLAEYGWFPHPSMLLGAKLLGDRISKDSPAVEQSIIDLFRNDLPLIESELVDLYPNRRHLLSKGFEAHRQGQYCLSILMFLAQADGIAYDKRSKNVFIKTERKTLGSERIQEQTGDILASFLLLLAEDNLPIWASKESRDSTFRGFNRHQVMHGESVDYDTEENSLKAVSLLSWLAVVVNYEPEGEQGSGAGSLP